MSKEIDAAVGVNRGKDSRHVDALMAAGGFTTNRPQGEPAPRTDEVSMARPMGIRGGLSPAPAVRAEAPAAPTVRDTQTSALKKVKPLKEAAGQKKLRRSPVPPPPRVAWLHLDQLVIDDSYQRALSEQGVRLIRRMVEDWDWARFKPLSVAAAGDGTFEIVDGQHSAIAAATHGSIDQLPCLVLTLATQAERARAFVGVNSERTALKSFALFRGRLVAGQEVAVAVQAAVADAGARLVETVSAQMSYAAGDVACVSTLLAIAKGGGRDGLARVLRICVQAGVGPIPAALLRALDQAVRLADVLIEECDVDSQLIAYISGLGLDQLMTHADATAISCQVNRRGGLERLFAGVLER